MHTNDQAGKPRSGRLKLQAKDQLNSNRSKHYPRIEDNATLTTCCSKKNDIPWPPEDTWNRSECRRSSPQPCRTASWSPSRTPFWVRWAPLGISLRCTSPPPSNMVHHSERQTLPSRSTGEDLHSHLHASAGRVCTQPLEGRESLRHSDIHYVKHGT